MSSTHAHAVNTVQQQPALKPTSTSESKPNASNNGSKAAATKLTPAQIVKAQAAAAVKVNPDGTVGPHHKVRVPRLGQPGYKVNVKT
jgi:hypothetical protein